MNASSGRDERRAELAVEADRCLLFARALDELADLVEVTVAPVCAYGPIWQGVALRLRRDALGARAGAQRATDRLIDIEAAEQAAGRWIPHR